MIRRYRDDEDLTPLDPGGPSGPAVVRPKYLSLAWTHTDDHDFALKGFRVAVFEGSDPNDTSKYLTKPNEYTATERAAVITLKLQAAVTINAAVQALYLDGNESSWRLISGGVAADPDTLPLGTRADLETVREELHGEAAAAVAAAATAQGTADGKARIYYQAAAPTGLGSSDQGDLWVDTDDNLKVWAWTGSVWVVAQDWFTANAAATAAGQAAAYADMLARSPHNLVKNGNSSNPTAPSSTPEGLGLYNNGFVSVLSPARWVRLFAATTSAVLNSLTDMIPCVAGDQFMAQCQGTFATAAAGGNVRLILAWFNSDGGWFDSTASSTITAVNSNYAAPSTISVSGTAPSGAAAVKVCVYTDGLGSGTIQYVVNNFYACRKISAGMLEADLAILGVIRSPNYVAGSYGNAPQGFKLSGYAFTTTFADGSTDSNCFMELSGSANFGGYKVATVNSRAMTAFNRILNGTFYSNMTGWGSRVVTGSVSVTVGEALQPEANVGYLSLETASILNAARLEQPFTCPPTSATVNVTLQTTIRNPIGQTSNGSVKCYLYNASTQTETLVATWTYASANHVGTTWTNRSADITSLVNSGGDYVLSFEMSIYGSSAPYTSIAIDNVKVII